MASGDRTGSRPRARCALPALERRPTAPCPWRGAPDAEPEPGTEHTRTPTPPAWRHTTLKTGRLEHGCFQGKQLCAETCGMPGICVSKP